MHEGFFGAKKTKMSEKKKNNHQYAKPFPLLRAICKQANLGVIIHANWSASQAIASVAILAYGSAVPAILSITVQVNRSAIQAILSFTIQTNWNAIMQGLGFQGRLRAFKFVALAD